MTEQRLNFTLWQLVALTAVLLLAFAASLGMPYNIDAIVRSFTASNFEAGLVSSTEMAAIAAGNLLFARLAARLHPHRVYLFGALAIFGLNALSLFAGGVWDLLLLRVPAGFALGAVVSTVMATAARSATPESTFGVINAMVGVMGMAMAFVLPRALGMHQFANEHLAFGEVAWSELDGLYLIYVLCALGALPFIRGTPSQPPAASATDAGAPSKGVGWLGLFGLGLMFHGHGALGLFMFRIGREAGLAAEVAGYVLAAGALVGIVAPLLTGFLASRMKPLPPLLVLSALMTVSGLVMSNLQASWAFVAATPVFAALPIAYMPIVLGVLARFDSSGALVGAHPAFVLIGGAVAPFVGGAISAATGGFAANGWFMVVCIWLGMCLCWPVLRLAVQGRRTTG